MSLARAALALGALLAAGCGYSTGLTVPKEDGSSLGILYFDNLTPERDVEAELYDELARAARSLVDAPLRAPGTADLLVQGTIVSYHRRGGVKSSDNEQIETGLTIEVEATLWRRRRPEDPPPPPEPAGAGSTFGDAQKVRLSSRGLVYSRGTFQPGTPRRPDPDWIQVRATRAGAQVGYILQDALDGEPAARARALRNVAQRIVLDLFTPVN